MPVLNRLLLIYICGFLFKCSTKAHENASQISSIKAGKDSIKVSSFPEEDLEKHFKQFKTKEFKVDYDPEFKSSKKFEGLSSYSFFNKYIIDNQIDTSLFKVVFICIDGYRATATMQQILDLDAILVNKDLEADKSRWKTEDEAKFSPFYFTWTKYQKSLSRPYPYAITSFQFVEKESQYLAAKPLSTNKDVVAGFKIFEQKCIKCHAINGEGGILGPELNYPVNITEYWRSDYLKAFIRNPQSVRHQSKMPMLTELSSININQIVDYLFFMKGQKKTN
jgi:mono/diheme cytochrome c family protein